MRQPSLSQFTWVRPTEPATIGTVGRVNVPPDLRFTPIPAIPAIVFGPAGWEVEAYEPMAEPLLFSEFGRLARSPTAEAMARFAGEWGPLTETREGMMVAGERRYYDAEPLSLWKQEVKAFGEAYKLWALLSASARESSDLRSIEPLLSNPRLEAGLLEEIGEPRSRAELSRAGWLLFDEHVNHHLVRLRVGPRLFFNVATGHPALRLSPTSLIGAIWLQLAQAADRKFKALQCPRCGDWFPRNPKSRGHRDTYCSTKCRVAIDRRRRKARALASAGKTPAAIARTLRTDVRTLREWMRPR